MNFKTFPLSFIIHEHEYNYSLILKILFHKVLINININIIQHRQIALNNENAVQLEP